MSEAERDEAQINRHEGQNRRIMERGVSPNGNYHSGREQEAG